MGSPISQIQNAPEMQNQSQGKGVGSSVANTLPAPAPAPPPTQTDQATPTDPNAQTSAQGMPMGKGNMSYSPTSGQPAMGQPNPYPNTVGMGDNSANTPSTGKGKGA